MILGGLFDVANLENKKNELDVITKKEDFWTNLDMANKTYQELKNINKILDLFK